MYQTISSTARVCATTTYMYMHACIRRSAQQEAVLKNMLSEHDYKCLYNTRNRAFTVGKMLGAVYRYWYVYKRDVSDLCMFVHHRRQDARGRVPLLVLCDCSAGVKARDLRV